MLDAMKKVEDAGGKVSYNAPLLLPKAVMEKYNTVSFGVLQGVCPMGDPRSLAK